LKNKILVKFKDIENSNAPMRRESISKMKIEKEKALPWLKMKKNWIKAMYLNYGRSITEILDFIKDVLYAANGMHKTLVIAILIWIFALFAIVYTAFEIMFLTREFYKEVFGDEDLKELGLESDSHF